MLQNIARLVHHAGVSGDLTGIVIGDGTFERGFVKLYTAFTQISCMYFGNGHYVKRLLADELFHDAIGCSAFADTYLLDLQSSGLAHNPVQNEPGLGGIADEGTKINRLKKTQGPVLTGSVENGGRREKGIWV